jgi:glycosyltransferase involved in cell wall biosynthesis
MRIAIATDAWVPQVNGVVRTLTMTVNQLIARGHAVELIVPDQFMTVPMPGYREIRLALAPRTGIRRTMQAFAPDIVHIVTDIPFTTAFHTRFPDYASVRTGLSADWFWPVMRRFHARSRAVFVSTARLKDELAERGISGGRLWSRGIDAALFNTDADPHPLLADLPRPLLLSVGRVAAEKNLDAFLSADVAGTKVVVGDGPALAELKRRYPNALFLGALHGGALASAYVAADLFVFPSRTDTFGLVMIEALACGVPVAAYPVLGPLDILGVNGRGPDGGLPRPVGALDEDLAAAMRSALTLDRVDAAAFGRSFTWDHCTDQFVAGLRHACVQASPLPEIVTLQA